jgi:hypothetical protein
MGVFQQPDKTGTLLHHRIRNQGREKLHIHAHLIMVIEIVELRMAVLTGSGEDCGTGLLDLIDLDPR